MRKAVESVFLKWSEQFEGSVSWMYQDILGLVSTGIGNLIDFGKPVPDMNAPRLTGEPPEAALTLPWYWKLDGRPASRSDIASEWHAVKAHPTAAKRGHRVLEGLTNLRLSEDGIRELVLGKARLNEVTLRARFPHFDEWPAEAQLATHSMAWACGPAFHFPALAAALNAGDFYSAAARCHIDDSHNPGVTPRNAANVWLYECAQRVQVNGEDRETLRLHDGSVILPEPEETAPNTMPIIHANLDWSSLYEQSKKNEE